MEEFDGDGVLFLGQDRMGREMDRRIKRSVCSDADSVSVCRGEEAAEPKCHALDFPVNLRSDPSPKGHELEVVTQ